MSDLALIPAHKRTADEEERMTVDDWRRFFLRDNPFRDSLRQHAGFWASVARRRPSLHPRHVRVMAARRAMGCLLAAREVPPSRGAGR